MTTYTADAYNPLLPLDTAMAGDMNVELHALKERMNADLGYTAPLLTSIKDQLEALQALAVQHGDGITQNADWITAFESTWSDFLTLDAQWKAAREQDITALDSKMTTVEANIVSIQTDLDALENS